MCATFNSITFSYSFLVSVFSLDHGFYLKKQGWCFTFKSSLNIRNLKVYFDIKTGFILYKR